MGDKEVVGANDGLIDGDGELLVGDSVEGLADVGNGVALVVDKEGNAVGVDEGLAVGSGVALVGEADGKVVGEGEGFADGFGVVA